MQQVYDGKTKTVFRLDDGNYMLQFKDDATGEDGVFDPGANSVGLTIEGLGKESLRLSKYYFELLNSKGINTQYISCDIDNSQMTVKPAEAYGKGLEIICRYRAVGSFFRRYGAYVKEGRPLNALVEITIKDDKRNDPPISRDALNELGIMSNDEYDEIKGIMKQCCEYIKEDLKEKGLTLYDIKLEFGKVAGEICLIDEISGGNMRVYKDSTYLEPLALAKIVLG